MLANSSRHILSKAIGFMQVIEQTGAEDAFESAYEYSLKVSLELQRLKQIKDIHCLIIWRKNDKLIFLSDADTFKNTLDNSNVVKQNVM